MLAPRDGGIFLDSGRIRLVTMPGAAIPSDTHCALRNVVQRFCVG